MTTLQARVLFCGDLGEGVIGVLAAEEETGEGARVELQRATSFDEQDRAAGMDTYCVSLHAGASFYGGVGSWELGVGHLVLGLSKEAMEVLGLEGALVIEFDPKKTKDLEVWLPRVLKGEG